MHATLEVRRAHSVTWHILIRRTMMHVRVTNEESARIKWTYTKRKSTRYSISVSSSESSRVRTVCIAYQLAVCVARVFLDVHFRWNKVLWKLRWPSGGFSSCIEFPIRRSQIFSSLYSKSWVIHDKMQNKISLHNCTYVQYVHVCVCVEKGRRDREKKRRDVF